MKTSPEWQVWLRNLHSQAMDNRTTELRGLRTNYVQLEGRIGQVESSRIRLGKGSAEEFISLTTQLEDLRASRDATLAEINAIPR